jgi:hypothetical protein
MSEAYAGKQVVGINLHRRRSVIVRMTESGERLETVRILNDRDRLAEVMARAGESPERSSVCGPVRPIQRCGYESDRWRNWQPCERVTVAR